MKRTIVLTIALLSIATLSGCTKLSNSNAVETPADTPMHTASPSAEDLRVANSPMPSADTDARDDDPNESQQMTLDDVRAVVQEKRFNLSPEDFAAFAGEYTSDDNRKYWRYQISGGKWELEISANYVDGDRLSTSGILFPIGFEFCPQRYINIDMDDIGTCVAYVEAYDGTQTQLSASEEADARAVALDYYADHYSDKDINSITRITDVTKFEGAVIFDRIKGKLAAFYTDEYQSRLIILTQADSGEWEVINEGY